MRRTHTKILAREHQCGVDWCNRVKIDSSKEKETKAQANKTKLNKPPPAKEDTLIVTRVFTCSHDVNEPKLLSCRILFSVLLKNAFAPERPHR